MVTDEFVLKRFHVKLQHIQLCTWGGFFIHTVHNSVVGKTSILNSVLYWINITCKCLYYTVRILILCYLWIIANKDSLSAMCLNARHAVVFKAHWILLNSSAAVIKVPFKLTVWINIIWYYKEVTHIINILKDHFWLLYVYSIKYTF